MLNNIGISWFIRATRHEAIVNIREDGIVSFISELVKIPYVTGIFKLIKIRIAICLLKVSVK